MVVGNIDLYPLVLRSLLQVQSHSSSALALIALRTGLFMYL